MSRPPSPACAHACVRSYFVVSFDETNAECLAAMERKALYSRDPVNTLNLRTFALEQLAALAAHIGGPERMATLVGPDTYQQLLQPPSRPPVQRHV
jgi:hypothetical protein